MPRAKKDKTTASQKTAPSERIEMKEDVKDTFPSKTYDMIEHCDQYDPDVACWDEDGTAFVIKDVSAIASSYLPKKFEHSNFQSFVRQLNLYGFRNVSKERDGGSGDKQSSQQQHVTFHNENFIRGRRDLLRNIQRSKKGDRSQRKSRQEEELHAVSAALNKRFDGVELEVKALHAKVDSLTAKLDRVLGLLLAPETEGGNESGGYQNLNHKKRRQDGLPQAKRIRNDDYAEPMDALHVPPSIDRANQQSVSARGSSLAESDNSTEDSLPRNVSPAVPENLRAVVPLNKVLPSSRVSSVTDENTENREAASYDKPGYGCRNNDEDIQPIDPSSTEQELYDANLLEACRSILDGADAPNPPDEDGAQVPSSHRATPANGTAPQSQGAAPQAQTDPEFGDLDALPLSMSLDSSSLSADDILASIPGNLHGVAIYDHTNNDPPPAPIRYGGNSKKFAGRQTLLAGITLMSMIAAIAVGVSFGVGSRNAQSDAGQRLPPPTVVSSPESEDTKVAACPDCDGPYAAPGAPGGADESSEVVTTTAEDGPVTQATSNKPTDTSTIAPSPGPSGLARGPTPNIPNCPDSSAALHTNPVADWNSVAGLGAAVAYAIFHTAIGLLLQ